MAETCKIGEEHENFVVLTTPRSLAMKYIDVKRTLAKRLHGGDALRMISTQTPGLANSAAHDNAIWLQTLQAQFLECTKTHWIHDKGFNHPHMTHPLYNFLWDMKLSHWLATESAQPLFHNISPMETKEGYLVRYLPQYGAQAHAAIAKLPH